MTRREWGDRHLAYVGMIRHREGAEFYAGRDDFKGFDDLKERLSRARPKDSTLDYAQRRGDGSQAQRPGSGKKEQPAPRQERTQRPETREQKDQGQEREAKSGAGRSRRDAFQASPERNSFRVARLWRTSDPKAKVRAGKAARGDEAWLPRKIRQETRPSLRAAEREGVRAPRSGKLRPTRLE